ncbi:hypothetical protein MMC08_008086 [Hypocenomyce scalaris]|nr:hypothetical protein [Hypocenomyce scalaris]
MTCSFLLFVLMKINFALTHAPKDSLLSDDPPKYSLADCATSYDPCTLLPVSYLPQPPKLSVEIPSHEIFSPKIRAKGYQNLEKETQREEKKGKERERRREKRKGKAREEERLRDRRLEGLKRVSGKGAPAGVW